ncbi:MAG: T9SS type A sorting domain-containing protein [Bacteroidetes bacterium]|jgi:hypothetical protein|nr:T9SS type A sorting domain-containing protein [Bacteroidota bacterium]MDF1864083.1 T9SS type A sorting domain-containing protein [Saprospiraceae bacterium]
MNTHKGLNSKIIFLTLLSFLFIQDAFSQDTLTVQTFDWDSNTRRDTFQFPDDPDQSWRKILMVYNMRCHDVAVGNGGVGCREWDYSCNTFITDPSRADSTRQTHPNFIISNFNGPVFDYANNQTNSFIQYEMYSTNLIASSGSEASVGDGNEEWYVTYSSDDYKQQFLYTADELITGGLTGGSIYGLKLDCIYDADEIDFFRIRIKHTEQSEFSDSALDFKDYTEVYFSNYNFEIGLNDFLFYQPFEWDGTSNLIVEFSFAQGYSDIDNTIKAYETNKAVSLKVDEPDSYLQFEGVGIIDLPTNKFSDISNEISISFWANGIEDALPRNTSIFEGSDDSNNRQVNVHFPWSNGQIYWDCGNDGTGYDRINKQATEAEYEGSWNHWAFTKNAITGEMKIYLNGELWHSGTGLFRPIDIQQMKLGANVNGGNNYFGGVDDFQVWDIELSQADIKEWMHKKMDFSHPFHDNLKANYTFSEGSGSQTKDQSPLGQDVDIFLPNWKKLKGKDLFKNPYFSNLLPNIVFLQGDAEITLDTTHVLDEVPNGIHSVVEYNVFGESVEPIDTSFLYPSGNILVKNEAGEIVDTIYQDPDGQLEIDDLVYYQVRNAKFEILSLVTPYGNGLDLGEAGKTFTFDVTDYAPILKGEKVMSIEMGGQWQEELDIKFLFIEGTPPRDILNIQNIWPFRRGGYADIQNDRFFEPRNIPLSLDGSHYKVRSAVTGHGQNGEFIPREHYINVNGGTQEFPYQVWKECGDNPIYPQGGTWIFDRAGWCPGAATDVHEFWLTNLGQIGDEVNIDYGVNGPYMGQANYLVSNQLVTYGDYNYALDASIERIARPNVGDVEFERINPACNYPLIQVKNTGEELINSLTFEYNVEGGIIESYTWTGEILPLEIAEIELPVNDVDFWETTDEEPVFEVKISSPNGQLDENPDNDFASMPFESARIFDYDGDPLELTINTNLIAYDNYYTIKDSDGNIVMERDSLEANQQYKEALELPAGCYTMNFYDIANDGLEFWFFPENGQGFLRFRRYANPQVALSIKSFDPDFGAGVQFDFIIPETTHTKDLDHYRLLSTYPNPTSGDLNVELHGFQNEDFEIEIIDLTGKILKKETIKNNPSDQIIFPIDVADLNAGMYFVRVLSEDRVWTQQFVKN